MSHMSQMTKMSQMSCMGVPGVHGGEWVCEWVHVVVQGCVWNEFSEYLLETRFLTSANYNPHPLQIFSCDLERKFVKIVKNI